MVQAGVCGWGIAGGGSGGCIAEMFAGMRAKGGGGGALAGAPPAGWLTDEELGGSADSPTRPSGPVGAGGNGSGVKKGSCEARAP